MRDKTTNQIIHEWIGKCWHVFEKIDEPGRDLMQCSKCGLRHARTSWITLSPDYENDLNAVREAELKAIEEFGQFKYLDALYLVMFGTVDAQTIVTDLKQRVNMITAPASVRAQAIRRLVEERNG